jgi:hypothetical protein
MLRTCFFMHSRIIENHPIRILEDRPLISEGVLSPPPHHVVSCAIAWTTIFSPLAPSSKKPLKRARRQRTSPLLHSNQLTKWNPTSYPPLPTTPHRHKPTVLVGFATKCRCHSLVSAAVCSIPSDSVQATPPSSSSGALGTHRRTSTHQNPFAVNGMPPPAAISAIEHRRLGVAMPPPDAPSFGLVPVSVKLSDGCASSSKCSRSRSHPTRAAGPSQHMKAPGRFWPARCS